MTTHNGKRITQRGGMDGEYGKVYAEAQRQRDELFAGQNLGTGAPSYSGTCDNCGTTGPEAFTHLGVVGGFDRFSCSGPDCGMQVAQDTHERPN